MGVDVARCATEHMYQRRWLQRTCQFYQNTSGLSVNTQSAQLALGAGWLGRFQ